jgi:serine phosphatase RsbU (regulator of sigma subunit)
MKLTFLIFLCFSQLLNSFSQQSNYEISYYSARDYGKGHEAANWACVQDKDGVLYFGNAGGLLQYDGINWNFISIKQQSVWVKSLAVSYENIIYVGAQNEFGYLAPDASGKLSYVSLSDKLDKNHKLFSDIIRVWTWKNKVAFQSEEAIFLFSNNELTSILPETSFHISFLVNDELFVRQREIGIMKLVDNKLQLIEGSSFFKNSGIFSVLQSSDKDKFIVITRKDGFWLVDKNSFHASQIKTDNSELFNLSEIYGAIRLRDGKIALNTLSNGIIITDEHFKIIKYINKNNGLKVNGVLSLIQDYQENIWASLDNGIAQVHYSSPISVFGPASGVSGNISAIAKCNGKLFVGSTHGLFIQEENSSLMSSAFTPFPYFTKEIRNFYQMGSSLLTGTQYGLFEINNEKIKKINDAVVSALYFSEKLKLLFVAEKKGLVIYQQSGELIKIKEIPEITEEIIRFEEEDNRAGTTIWMGTALQGIVRLKFTSLSNYVVDKYNSSDGLINNNWIFPLKINNKIVFSQHTGLMQFVDEESLKKQLPDSLKNKPEFNRGYFDYYYIDSVKERMGIPFYAVEDTKDRIYANLDGDLGYYDKSSSLSWITAPFCLADIGKANVFFHENSGICWIGGDDGLMRFDERKIKNYSVDFNTILTLVTCTGDSVLFSGYAENTYNLEHKKQTAKNPVLNYNLNTLSFHFAAPFFEGQEKMLYSYTLTGQNKIYSPWRLDNKVVFTNLLEGSYIFKVKAKNAYGHMSSESTFVFTILPPWYRSIWAVILYMVLFLLFVYSGIRINSRRLIAKNRKLEEIILDRTQEIKQKNVVLVHQKQEILDSINYALRIQKAVLPDPELTNEWLGEHFILFKPKDIVSGDFYWATKYNEFIFFCVADCTGHGVPGAFMSMLCISFLNEVVLKEKITQSDEILNKIRTLIIESLKQKGISGEQKDGMDITLCIINKETLMLQYSGANNPLYIIRNKDKEPIPCDKQQEYNNHILYEIKGDAMPIAIYIDMDPFVRHNIKLLKGDRLYLFSDGIADQFGGPSGHSGGKKFMYKTFKTALMETCTSDMENQKVLVEKKINDWMAYENPETGQAYDQLDDICLMGLKV